MASEQDSEQGSETGIMLMNLEEEDFTNGSLVVSHSMYKNFETPYPIISAQTFTNNLDVLGKTETIKYNGFTDNSLFQDRIAIRFSDYKKLFSEGTSLKVSMTNIRNYVIDSNGVTHNWTTDTFKYVRVYFRDIAGNYTHVNKRDATINNSGKTYDVSFSIDSVPYDTYEIYFEAVFSPSGYENTSSLIGGSGNFVRYGGFNKSKLNIVESDVTVGLLGNIIEFLTNILDGIINLPALIANALSSLFDMVVSAITSLGDFIIEGIKGLFVPSQEDIIAIKENWDNLLEDRFGALYEVIELIDNYASSFSAAEKTTIIIPSISVPVAGSTFTFGGQTVKVIPDGFGTLINSLKLIISILATCLFVNGLRNRFERVVGSE